MITALDCVKMVSFLPLVFHVLAVIFMGLDAPVGVSALNLEEQVLLLQEKYVHLEARIQQHDILVEKVARLELALMEKEPNINSVSKSAARSAFPRTCAEAKASDPSLPSGMQWIDPDGQGVGDDAIYVYCDMVKGSTLVPHDSEFPTDVGHCTDPGCYSRAVIYNATSRQMNALVQLSSECHQSIKYDCVFAPLELNDVTFGWWNDKSGKPKYFWSGGNSDVHTCQCGIEGNCVETNVNCNCDTAAPIRLSDDGVITDKEILPITQLNFGRTQLESSSGTHTLGRFECTGKIAVNGMPTSCEDLWLIGHSLNGLYSIMGVEMVESVYCDFTKLPNDPGFQTWIGFTDIQSLPTYFHVKKNYRFDQTGIPVPFEIERLNIGGAMNLETGKFTAPRKGTYFFSFSGIAAFPGNVYPQVFQIDLYKNGLFVSGGYSHEANIYSYDTFNSIHSTLALQAGDQVWLQIRDASTGAQLDDWVDFVGWILREDIFQSLVM